MRNQFRNRLNATLTLSHLELLILDDAMNSMIREPRDVSHLPEDQARGIRYWEENCLAVKAKITAKRDIMEGHFGRKVAGA